MSQYLRSFPIAGLALIAVLWPPTWTPLARAAQSAPAKPKPATASPPAAHTQRSFASAQTAADALYAAARKDDEGEIVAILGEDSRNIVLWTGDVAERRAEIQQFVKKYEQMHRLVQEPDREVTLYVGAENWPLPVPLFERGGQWYFEAGLARQEILYRRIGENELDAIDILHAMVDAENEYYSLSAEQGGVAQYARRFNSRPGTHNGLYWPSTDSASSSPAGPYIAEASFNRPDRVPFHGYYFRILDGQGANAFGGAKNYVVDGKMTGGFAFVAFPALYRSSGVKTFIVNRFGSVYEKDLGPSTAKIAASLNVFNPDATWAAVR